MKETITGAVVVAIAITVGYNNSNEAEISAVTIRLMAAIAIFR